MLREFRTLLPYLKKYRLNYLLGLVFLVTVDAAQLAIPQFVRRAVDDLSLGRTGEVPRLALAVVGVVTVKVSAENGPIAPGDLLVASGTAGHAMRCVGVDKCFGRTIGKALEGLDAGTGTIRMLVVLQ